MRWHAIGSNLASVPARIALTVAASFVTLLIILSATHPAMVMDMLAVAVVMVVAGHGARS